MLNEIKRLHDIGLSIIYLHSKTKRPIDTGWTKAPNKVWKDLKRGYQSGMNIGVRLGEHSVIRDRGYLACIDVDIIDPAFKKQALEALESITLGEVFPEVRSGSGNGSRHLYCVTLKAFKQITLIRETHPTNIDENGKPLKVFEIAIYSTGRQMVLPPSVHPVTGELYQWRVDLRADNIPVFDPTPYVTEKEDREKSTGRLDFKAVDVDLEKTSLNSKTIDLICEGKGCDDRSAGLLSAALSMCRADMTDNEILSVLSNRDYWLGEAAYEHRQTSSRKNAVDWLYKYTLVKAREETSARAIFDNAVVIEAVDLDDEDAIKAQEEETKADSRRMPDMNQHGRPMKTLRNVLYILETQVGKNMTAFDEFANKASFTMDTPYGGRAGRELTDGDDLALRRWIADHYEFEPSKELCFEGHSLVARANRFHPVRDWLSGLRWDGKPRLDHWLVKGLGAKGDCEYITAVGRKTLVAAVARIYEPACKFDYVMILEGLQGAGKSTALSMLASAPWFTDGIGRVDEKDVVDQMTGKWIIELGELASLKKADSEVMKSFITRQSDRVRMPYGRRSEDYPRQSIFIGTTNKEEYFQDETGNRRYWPVKIEKNNFEWIKKNRTQIFAEAVEAYWLGERLYLEESEEAIARKVQSSKYIVDELEPKVIQWAEENGKEKFTTTEVYQGVFMSADVPNQVESTRLGKILGRLHYERLAVRIGGQVVKGWRKKRISNLF